MRNWKSLLILLLAVGFISSVVYAKRITGKTNFQIGSVNAMGNLDISLAIPVVTGKAIKFPKSGTVINRAKGKVVNLSGTRQRFVNDPIVEIMFDPETLMFTLSATRSRYVVQKGNKRNFAQSRLTSVFKP